MLTLTWHHPCLTLRCFKTERRRNVPCYSRWFTKVHMKLKEVKGWLKTSQKESNKKIRSSSENITILLKTKDIFTIANQITFSLLWIKLLKR